MNPTMVRTTSRPMIRTTNPTMVRTMNPTMVRTTSRTMSRAAPWAAARRLGRKVRIGAAIIWALATRGIESPHD
jgi:hypothetical protein